MDSRNIFRLKRLLLLLSFLLVVIPTAASGHPLKASASLITYDTVNKTIQMECKVFIDDFQRSLLNSVAKGTDPSKVRRQDRHRLVEAYFELFYTIEHNGKRIPLKLSGIQPLKRQNVLVIRFAKVPVKMQKGDSLRIQNTMFFRDFGAAQSNRIAVRIPLFGINDGHVATIRDHIFSYKLGESKR